MSTDLLTYLNYIAGLKDATDSQIQDIIDERANFILIGKTADFMTKVDSGIKGVFDTIDKLAKELEEEEIADESIKLAEDAAAVAAVWSFGLSMAAFVPLTATDAALRILIKKKESELNSHLASADKDIGDKVGGVGAQYVDLFKKNNDFIKASSPTGMTPQTARSYLYNYMDYISRHGGVSLANFRECLKVAELTKDDPNISKILAILDEFTLSDDHGAAKIQEALDNMGDVGLQSADFLGMARGFTYAIWMYRMKVSSDTLKEAAAAAKKVPEEEAEPSVFENMDVLGKFTAGLTIMISVVDIGLNIYNIVETVKRYEENASFLKGARGQYKDYFQNLYDASKQYNPKQ